MGHVTSVGYSRGELLLSDHKPVCSELSVKVRMRDEREKGGALAPYVDLLLWLLLPLLSVMVLEIAAHATCLVPPGAGLGAFNLRGGVFGGRKTDKKTQDTGSTTKSMAFRAMYRCCCSEYAASIQQPPRERWMLCPSMSFRTHRQRLL